MSNSLETWCADAKRILKEKPVNEARAALAETLKGLLVDPGFISTHFDEQKGEPQKIIYRDPELGFFVMVHHHKPGRKGPPHDHGDSWAIYGVSRGYTEMTEWRRQDNGSKPDYAEIEPDQSYRLDVGMTAAYGPKVIHNTHHPEGAWVVRVTGCDLDAIPRLRFTPERKEVKEFGRTAA